MTSVIVFGPTGNVGSVAARTAEAHGAKVWLAMRDTSKAIPGLTAEEEKAGRYERLQADLNKPETLTAAVSTSGAKRVFIYLVHGSKDAMKSTLETLKSAGVEFVVFLSSFTIWTEPRDIPSSEIIPYIHATVEISLEKVFGVENFVALRPGAFATNIMRHRKGIDAGNVSLFGSGWVMDCITPTDMGKVGGVILVEGPRDAQRHIYLYGPQLIRQGEAIKIVGKVLGKDIEITEYNEQEAREQYAKDGLPKPFAEYMLRAVGRSPEEASKYRVRYDEGVENVQLYTGHKSTGFEEWVKANTKLFTS